MTRRRERLLAAIIATHYSRLDAEIRAHHRQEGRRRAAAELEAVIDRQAIPEEVRAVRVA